MSEIINLKNNDKLNVFIEAAKAGAVFAYPTEAVYGLGCNINNKDSIKKILKIKKRDVSKGLIIISDNLEKVRELIDDNYFKLFTGPFGIFQAPEISSVPKIRSGFVGFGILICVSFLKPKGP